MKKLLAIMLITGLSLNLVACGKDTTEPTTESTQTITEETTEVVESTEAIESTDATESTEAVDETGDTNAGDVATGDTVGNTLAADFVARVTENENLTTEEIATKLCENPILVIGAGPVPVTEGLLVGFGNTEIKGFDEGTMFAPMIGTIPFVGYVFQVSEGTDVETFITTLKENGDLAWNICTQADEMVVESVGQKVMFVMCPASFEE